MSLPEDLRREFETMVERALEEDRAFDDLTGRLLIPGGLRAAGRMIAGGRFVVCGLPVAEMVFRRLDARVRFAALVEEGGTAAEGDVLCEVEGEARALLAAERTALNFVQLACAVATRTARMVEAVRPLEVDVLDTRKTLPGLRALQKYAVRTGGGRNHRLHLAERVMVKDNHKALLDGDASTEEFWRGIRAALGEAAERAVVEAETPEEAEAALRAGFRHIMLDNFARDELARTVRGLRAAGDAVYVEASGGLGPDDAAEVARAGVDGMSAGALTRHLRTPEVSFEVERL